MGFIRRIYKLSRIPFRPLKRIYYDWLSYKGAKELEDFVAKTEGKRRIFYLGRTTNVNLGDNAQHFCIKNWIKKNYPDYIHYMTPSYNVVNRWGRWLKTFKQSFDYEKDIIIFQSGYCTQDLGGDHTLMHELICKHLSGARILMMPQTVYFQNDENMRRVSTNHNTARHMLFLARDEHSYAQAKDMFPDIRVKLFPDIVTTLIGKYNFDSKREKIFLCCRNDGEKFYTEKEINRLRKQLESIAPVEFGDTQSNIKGDILRSNFSLILDKEIERLSKFKVVITDRYHGTILALCANTPVIILKTNDHKVVTGADWFKGVYDNHVFVAENLNIAFQHAQLVCKEFDYKQLSPYFEEQYYNKLKDLFENYSS